MQQHYQDAMAIMRHVGRPDLFKTMTCNPKWIELQTVLENFPPGTTPNDIPIITVRLFYAKFLSLLDDIENKNLFGRVKAWVYTIEFQKRGLFHAHLLVTLHLHDKLKTPEQIDKHISAEISKDENLRKLVLDHQLHGPHTETSPCIQKGKVKCTKNYPKNFQEVTTFQNNGYPLYKRCNNVTDNNVYRTQYSDKIIETDNSMVVPYNAFLLRKYRCHINVEYCASIESVVTASQNQQKIVFEETKEIEALSKFETTLTAWFELNKNNDFARKIKYVNIAKYFNFRDKKWVKRVRKQRYPTIGRIGIVHPKDIERYHLKLILNRSKGATSFKDLRTYKKKIYKTYREVAIAMELVDNDKIIYNTFDEACTIMMPYQLRNYFEKDQCLRSESKKLFEKIFKDLNEDQKKIYHEIFTSKNKLFFIDGPGGSGMTSHRTFRLPFDLTDKSVFLKYDSDKRKLREAELIIWDEASMIPKNALEIVNKTLCDICDNEEPFGGKLVLLGGDFTQILPRRYITILLLFDFLTTFDTILDDLLLRFFNYLAHRLQALDDEIGVVSGWLSSSTGVPPKSVLGLHLFAIFINDFLRLLRFANDTIYADDTQIYIYCFSPDILDRISRAQHDAGVVME
ncbi:uncharacterized protein LOC131673286 [Phymastichus coffea]|uniref:uncharacterized protein LOC131673286 n=1 Tax=Phymastichus coffea TaxID=108790 RepID=UPI00273A757E|nr:uncharacterized protein LOC131673286 [Phymastichus coffea]